MQWYLKKYGVDVGKKKKAAAKEEKQDVGGGAGSWWLQAMGCTFYKNIKSVASQMVMGLLCDWASQRRGHQDVPRLSCANKIRKYYLQLPRSS